MSNSRQASRSVVVLQPEAERIQMVVAPPAHLRLQHRRGIHDVDTRFAQGSHRLAELLVAVELSDNFRNRCPVPAEE